MLKMSTISTNTSTEACLH